MQWLEGGEMETFAEKVAELVAKKLKADMSQELIGREELAKLTGLGTRTIDRMAKGECEVRLTPIKTGRRVLFDKAASLEAIRNK